MRSMTNPAGTTCVALLSCLFALSAVAKPAHVLIVVPPGAAPPAGFADQLSAWRQSGQVSRALLLDENQHKNTGFASLALLQLPSESSYERWSKEEFSKILAPLEVKRADVLTHGEVYPRDSNKSVFLVNTYKLLGPPEHSKEFLQGDGVPNLLDAKAAHLLLRYTMYLERTAGGDAL